MTGEIETTKKTPPQLVEARYQLITVIASNRTASIVANIERCVNPGPRPSVDNLEFYHKPLGTGAGIGFSGQALLWMCNRKV